MVTQYKHKIKDVPHLNCSSRTEDELIGEHVSEEAEAVEDLLWKIHNDYCAVEEDNMNFKCLIFTQLCQS